MRAYLLLLFAGWAAAQSTGDLRLVRNGLTSSSYTSGRLEIYYNGQWGTVCDDLWNSTNTAVACRQLGFSGASTTPWTTSSSGGFGSTTRPIWLDNVFCYGTESRLSSCSRNSYGSHDCGHSEDVAIYCTTTTSSLTPSTGDLRLVRNGLTSSSYTSGRLEIYYSGQWGTVCDDLWDSTNTRVACHQLGFSGASTTPWTTSSSGGFGSTSQPIWLDNVFCYGTELRLSSCSRNSYGSHNCGHSEDVAIYCTTTTSSQSTGDLRLVRNGLSSSSYTSGRLEIYYSGQWGTVCDDLWDSSNTRVACRQLGYSYSTTSWTTSSSGGFGSTTRSIWLDNVNCTGTESRLSSCSRSSYGSHNCGHSEDVAIYCSTSTGAGDSTYSPPPPPLPLPPDTGTVSVGIIIGASVGGFMLLVVIPIAICVIIGIVVAVSSSKHSRRATTVTTTAPAPTTTATITSSGSQSYTAQGYLTQSYPAPDTDSKMAPPPDYTAQQIEMSAYPPPTHAAYPPPTHAAYPPPTQAAYHPPTQASYPPPTEAAYNYPPPTEAAYPPLTQAAYPPLTEAAYPPPTQAAYPPPTQAAYPPPTQAAYPPPTEAAYHPLTQAAYPLPTQAAYPPPTQAAYPPPTQAAYPPQQP